MADLLANLAARCGQAGETECLEYFLSTAENLKKTPYLVLVGDVPQGTARGQAHTATGMGVCGAVLVLEYRALGGLRVFATADGSGRRNVWAEPAARARIVLEATRTLMERGAQMVQIVYSQTDLHAERRCHCQVSGAAEPAIEPRLIANELRRLGSSRKTGSWAVLQREIPSYLPLLATMNETLARMGQRTRSNMRYYRRRSEVDLGCAFVRDVEISFDQMRMFNGECAFAVAEPLLAWRFESLRRQGVFLHGMRGRDGGWLSLVAGRRHNGFVEIDWQMNRADLPAYSLSLVMRCYLMEHAIAEGSTRLYIEGGSVHPIMRSFVRDQITEITVKRRTPYAWALERFAARIFPEKNYLRQTLCNEQLEWRAW